MVTDTEALNWKHEDPKEGRERFRGERMREGGWKKSVGDGKIETGKG